ncbi:MAG: hypothetical protein Ct9H300mP7_0010 [Verrucomicrobiota bacterium]|nr:MAG: hypothetical protein Ct9H300mP7_0010 [Verrucomicrobiota bacterium]
MSWIGLDDKVHRVDATRDPQSPRRYATARSLWRPRPVPSQSSRHRTATFTHSMGAYNLGFTWRGNDFMDQVSGFGSVFARISKGTALGPVVQRTARYQAGVGIFWLASCTRGPKSCLIA